MLNFATSQEGLLIQASWGQTHTLEFQIENHGSTKTQMDRQATSDYQMLL